MKKIISIFITLAIILSLAACSQSEIQNDAITSEVTESNTEGNTEPEVVLEPATVNGVSLAEYTIVYDAEGLDYNKRAAEYIKNEIKARCGADIQIVDDSSSPAAHEIVVGETSREISSNLNEECDGLEFSMLVQNGNNPHLPLLRYERHSSPQTGALLLFLPVLFLSFPCFPVLPMHCNRSSLL